MKNNILIICFWFSRNWKDNFYPIVGRKTCCRQSRYGLKSFCQVRSANWYLFSCSVTLLLACVEAFLYFFPLVWSIFRFLEGRKFGWGQNPPLHSPPPPLPILFTFAQIFVRPKKNCFEHEEKPSEMLATQDTSLSKSLLGLGGLERGAPGITSSALDLCLFTTPPRPHYKSPNYPTSYLKWVE